MITFKELLQGEVHRQPLEAPSVSVGLSSTGHVLSLRFGPKEIITHASYTGRKDVWLASLCELLMGKDLTTISHMTEKNWEQAFGQDLHFWELWGQQKDQIFFPPLDLLKTALDKYQGREWPYLEASPLICRCFGVREEDVSAYLKQETSPTLSGLGVQTKASMGCRSCLPQLERWFARSSVKSRFYKERSYADWLVLIDEKLQEFPEADQWKMEVESFKGSMVVIGHQREASQKEQENMGQKLQGFLASLDPDLGFLLRRSRQR